MGNAFFLSEESLGEVLYLRFMFWAVMAFWSGALTIPIIISWNAFKVYVLGHNGVLAGCHHCTMCTLDSPILLIWKFSWYNYRRTFYSPIYRHGFLFWRIYFNEYFSLISCHWYRRIFILLYHIVWQENIWGKITNFPRTGWDKNMLHTITGESPSELGREEKTLTNVHIVHCGDKSDITRSQIRSWFGPNGHHHHHTSGNYLEEVGAHF